MANLYNVPLQNNIQRTLANTLNAGETSTITFSTSVSAVLQASASIPGLLVIDRVDVNGTATPSLTEYISFTGVSGSTVTGLTRGLAGSSDISHSVGAIVEFVPDVTWADAINDVITTEHDADGQHKINTFSNLNAPEGFLINGKIVPSVSSNNLTVALKTLAGNDPSASDPVYIRINGVIRTITSALSSLTANAGINWLNMGSAELATKEVDLFVYFQWNTTTSSVNILVSRLPYATKVGDFDGVGTQGNAAFGYVNYNATDSVVNIGRFAATLSAGAGYTWSVPTFDTSNLIQRPIYETRWRLYTPTVSGSGSMTLSVGTIILARYKIVNNITFIQLQGDNYTTGGTASNFIRASLPISQNSAMLGNFRYGATYFVNNGVNTVGQYGFGTTGVVEFGKQDVSNLALGTGYYFGVISQYEI